MEALSTAVDDYATLSWSQFYDQQKEIELDGVAHLPVKIRYIIAGESTGPTVLLLHGIPTWGFLYRHQIKPLVKAGFQVLVPDMLGHGFSDRRDRFDRSFQDQARMVCQLLKALGLANEPTSTGDGSGRKIHVVGHDTGGAVALILAIEHPAIVERLVLTNIVCYDRFDDDMLDFGHPMRWKEKPIEDLKLALQESLHMGLINRETQLTPDFAEGIMAPWLSEEGKLSLIRNASALNANQTMALVDRHGKITSPTLVLWAKHDPWQKWEDGRQLASEIPCATFKTIENASHWVQQDAPEEFTEEVLKFLQCAIAG